ncbi:hypothetical protein pb186bvf_007023 [Paramecium bursaria]
MSLNESCGYVVKYINFKSDLVQQFEIEKVNYKEFKICILIAFSVKLILLFFYSRQLSFNCDCDQIELSLQAFLLSGISQ